MVPLQRRTRVMATPWPLVQYEEAPLSIVNKELGGYCDVQRLLPLLVPKLLTATLPQYTA